MASFLKVEGTFWLFAAFSAIGFLFVYVFVKETMGMTDKQKKSLYE